MHAEALSVPIWCEQQVWLSNRQAGGGGGSGGGGWVQGGWMMEIPAVSRGPSSRLLRDAHLSRLPAFSNSAI